MPAYVVASIEVTDPETYQRYIPGREHRSKGTVVSCSRSTRTQRYSKAGAGAHHHLPIPR